MSKLTTKALDSLTSQDSGKTVYDSDGIRGKVRLTKTGISIPFIYRYSFNKKSKEFHLGVYPSTSLAEIRKKRNEVRTLLDKGIDPNLEKAISKEKVRREQAELHDSLIKAKERITVKDFFITWKKLHLKNFKDGGKEVERMFFKDVIPHIGEMAIEDVEKSHIIRTINLVQERGVTRMAKVIFSLIRQFFDFAIDQGLIENNPSATIKKARIGGKDVIRDRYLDDEEIVELKQKLPNGNFLKSTECAIWIMLSTLCRVGELIKAEWAHINLEKREWVIPKENSKNGKAHRIYLSDFAISYFKVLETIKSSQKWVFPNSNDSDHVSPKSISKQIGDRQLEDERLAKGQLSNRSKHMEAIKLRNGKWTPHDLRRSGATIMGNLLIRPDVIELCLNHTEPNRMKKTYQRQLLAPQQEIAWNSLGNHLTGLFNPVPNKVVTFGKRG